MKFKDIYKQQNNSAKNFPVISFEVFPPKDPGGNSLLIKELQNLMPYNPQVISVTYGAAGTGRENSINLVRLLKNNFDISIMPHFTCINASKYSVENYLNEISNMDIKNILALRGDIPNDENITNSDFQYANMLVEFIKSKSNLNIAVAGYPEGHIESENLETDIKNLKKKIEAGAEIIYTQLFFENSYFEKYLEKLRNAGINVPVIPGILPITGYNQLKKMTSLCKVTLPEALLNNLEKHKNSPDDIKKIGIEYAINQVNGLKKYNLSGFHFYILNKAFPTKTILEEVLKQN